MEASLYSSPASIRAISSVRVLPETADADVLVVCPIVFFSIFI